MRKPLGIRLLCLGALLAAVPACSLMESRPRVAIVVGGEATELERLAGSELASMLERLFQVAAAVGPAAGERRPGGDSGRSSPKQSAAGQGRRRGLARAEPTGAASQERRGLGPDAIGGRGQSGGGVVGGLRSG